MTEDPARILIERDALKAECIRMMDEIATLRAQRDDARQLLANFAQRYADLPRSAREICDKPLDRLRRQLLPQACPSWALSLLR